MNKGKYMYDHTKGKIELKHETHVNCKETAPCN